MVLPNNNFFRVEYLDFLSVFLSGQLAYRLHMFRLRANAICLQKDEDYPTVTPSMHVRISDFTLPGSCGRVRTKA